MVLLGFGLHSPSALLFKMPHSASYTLLRLCVKAVKERGSQEVRIPRFLVETFSPLPCLLVCQEVMEALH